jgi:hypothetical protein
MLRGAVLVHMSRLEYYCSARPCSMLESKSSRVKCSQVQSPITPHHISPRHPHTYQLLPTYLRVPAKPSKFTRPPSDISSRSQGQAGRQAGRQAATSTSTSHHTRALSSDNRQSARNTAHVSRNLVAHAATHARMPSLTDPTRHIRHSRLLLGARQRAKSRGMHARAGLGRLDGGNGLRLLRMQGRRWDVGTEGGECVGVGEVR